jgi:glutamate 5-kinase
LKTAKPEFKRIAVKVGSNVITGNDGSLNTGRILRIVEEIAILSKQGVEVIFITSGAVAAGRGDVPLPGRTGLISSKQIWAAVGQVKLMSKYQFLFGKYNIQAGQLLVAKESFRDRQHYLNMKNCISAMLENRVLPIVNENDTVSINELMFTDNDELSGLISSMMNCDSLIILTNVDGIFTGIPGSRGSELISEINGSTDNIGRCITNTRSGFGRGGMITKFTIARKLASEGMDVFIANGNRDSVIMDIVNQKDIPCTRFLALPDKSKSVKKWLSHSETFARGIVYVNKGAAEALYGEKATSLLMIGVSRIEGSFNKGDIIRILDEKGKQIGLGKSEYDSKKAEQILGEKREKPLVHYDYLLINEKN